MIFVQLISTGAFCSIAPPRESMLEDKQYMDWIRIGVREWPAHLFAARLDQKQGMSNATCDLVCVHAFQGVHLVRVRTALLACRAIS